MLGRSARIAALVMTSQLVVVACAEEIRIGAGMAERLRNVQFFVGNGRIQATPSYLATQNLRDSTKRVSTGGSESLSLAVHRGAPTIKYRQSRPGMSLSIDLTDGDGLLIKLESQDLARFVPLRFEQSRQADLQLSVGADANRRVIMAPSLWHLLLAEPDLCRRQLVPLLQLLQPDLRLMATAVAVEKSLFDIAASRTTQDRPRLRALVAKLASDRFEERRAAERELQQLGDPALPYLLTLDLSLLDAEQRRHVRRLTDEMTSQGRGGVMRIVAGLSADRSIWLSLMQRSKTVERRLAGEQLADLLDRNIEFDADADESTRAVQLEQLRLELASRPAPPWD